MKKFFKVLLLAAVALMPVMGMAQTNVSQEQWEREMRLKQYEDSMTLARLQANNEHLQNMAEIKHQSQITKMRTIWNEDLWILFVFAGCTITIVVLCLRHSRRKAEDHKELINKLIDNNLLNSTEPISKEAIEALMKPKKSDKDKYVTDATLLGVGLAGAIICIVEDLNKNSELGLIFFVLTGIGLLRIVTRAIFCYFENKNAKKKAAEAMHAPKAESIEEAEVVEEK